MGHECYALSPDGKTLVVQTSEPNLNRTMRFCDVGTGKSGTRIDLTGKDDRLEFAFSGDGKTLLVVAKDSLQLWDVATQTQRIASAVNAADFGNIAAISFDGKLLATAPQGKNNRVRLWATNTLTELPPLLDQPELEQGRNIWVISLAFTPDAKQLAVAHAAGVGLVRLWDLASRKMVRQFQANGDTQEMVFFADGKTLAGASGGRCHTLGYCDGQKARRRPCLRYLRPGVHARRQDSIHRRRQL